VCTDQNQDTECQFVNNVTSIMTNREDSYFGMYNILNFLVNLIKYTIELNLCIFLNVIGLDWCLSFIN
jgi:hypothetical protein